MKALGDYPEWPPYRDKSTFEDPDTVVPGDQLIDPYTKPKLWDRLLQGGLCAVCGMVWLVSVIGLFVWLR